MNSNKIAPEVAKKYLLEQYNIESSEKIPWRKYAEICSWLERG